MKKLLLMALGMICLAPAGVSAQVLVFVTHKGGEITAGELMPGNPKSPEREFRIAAKGKRSISIDIEDIQYVSFFKDEKGHEICRINDETEKHEGKLLYGYFRIKTAKKASVPFGGYITGKTPKLDDFNDVVSIIFVAPKAPKVKQTKSAVELKDFPSASRLPLNGMPVVTPVARQDDLTTDDVDDKDWRVFRFTDSAHFPLPRFDSEGCSVPTEGAVIFEGMTFKFKKKGDTDGEAQGDYQVSFLMTAPAMPVTLRMQLDVRKKNDGLLTTLTLPPVMIDPQLASRGNYKGSMYRVQIAGFSPSLTEVGKVYRAGVARFGYLPTEDSR